ncbi:hypothetical protein AA313_de0208120 [Arthrobotrys entomopaga]|nr:hypothetical protein AA313_de0208120 [Arthrobotrys entomopaga]
MREEHSRVFSPDFEETVRILREAPQKLNDLTYTTAVIQETLRLFPVGFTLREGRPGDTVIHNGTKYPVDEGLAIIPNAHAVQYNQAIFPEASKFQPSRFADPDHPVPRSHFWTFSRGPRGCMGLNLAQDEMRIILLLTIRDYDFECADLQPNEKPRVSFTDLDTVFGDIAFQELNVEAKPRGGMMMRVKRRC